MKYISLLPSSVITEGKERSCLIDVEKSIHCVVPKSLSNLFKDNPVFCYDDIYNDLDQEDQIVFKE
jgi:hypothetical protein